MSSKYTQKWKEVNQNNRTIRDNAYEFIDSKRKRMDEYPDIYNNVGVILSRGEIMRYRVLDGKTRLPNTDRRYLQPPDLPRFYSKMGNYYYYPYYIENYVNIAQKYVSHLEGKLPIRGFKGSYDITQHYNDLILSERDKQSLSPEHLEYVGELQKEVERLERLTAVLITEPPDKHPVYAPEVNEALNTIKVPPNLGGNYASLFKTFMEYHPTQLNKLATITSSEGGTNNIGNTNNNSSTDKDTTKPDAKGVTTRKHPDIVEADDLKFVRGNVKTLKRTSKTIKGITVSEVDYILVTIYHETLLNSTYTVKFSMVEPYDWASLYWYGGVLEREWAEHASVKKPNQSWVITENTYLIDVKALFNIYGSYADVIHLLFHGERQHKLGVKNNEIIKIGISMIKGGDRPERVSADQYGYSNYFTYTGKKVADFKMDCEIIWFGKPQKMFDVFIDNKTKEVVIYNHINEIKEGNKR